MQGACFTHGNAHSQMVYIYFAEGTSQIAMANTCPQGYGTISERVKLVIMLLIAWMKCQS